MYFKENLDIFRGHFFRDTLCIIYYSITQLKHYFCVKHCIVIRKMAHCQRKQSSV